MAMNKTTAFSCRGAYVINPVGGLLDGVENKCDKQNICIRYKAFCRNESAGDLSAHICIITGHFYFIEVFDIKPITKPILWHNSFPSFEEPPIASGKCFIGSEDNYLLFDGTTLKIKGNIAL